MILHSFRLKIGLLSVVLSGVLLLGFGAYAFSILSRVGLERMDHELRALADAQVRKSQPPNHWRRFDESLRAIYGQDARRKFLVKITAADGATLYTTADWPATLPLDVLPLSLAGAPEQMVHRPPDDNPRRPRDEREGRPPRAQPPPQPQPPAPPRQMLIRGPVYQTVEGSAGGWRAMTLANEEITLSLAMNLSGLRAETHRFLRALLVAIPLGLLLIVAGGWLTGQVALRPVNLIAQTAESVTAQHLHARIPDTRADEEFKRLIRLFNAMLERLERSFHQATRFSADAAHELKTPLAVLQAQVERTLQQAADGTPAQREAAAQLDEIQRLKSILRKLLLLAQADAGQLPLHLEQVNLDDLVRAATEDLQLLAPGRKVVSQVQAGLTMKGDANLLGQVLDNLVSNAVKFGDPQGPVEITLRRRGDQICLEVSNTGPAIPAPDRGKIFERFFRADKSRTRAIEGTGLGLSFAREIARAHGGDVMLARSDDTLTTFTLLLPLVAPPLAPFDTRGNPGDN